MDQSKKKIELRKSAMPSALEVQKYLEIIDKNEIYSNRGPLVKELEKRISKTLNISADNLIALSNGTICLELALRSIHKKENSMNYCLMPSFTFPATVSATISAGFTPYFVDICDKDFMLHPDQIYKYVSDLSDVAAVIPVSSFGAKIEKSEWDSFIKDTKINVIADEAWCFDNSSKSNFCFSMISLHATKVLGTGEGGILIFPEKKQKEIFIESANFGYDFKKNNIKSFGTNAKMSEYSAAVGLASLDMWKETKNKFLDLESKICSKMKNLKNIKLFPGFTDDWVWMSMVITGDQKIISKLQKNMTANNIETRSWWKNLCSDFNFYKNFPKTDLKTSEKISNAHLNLPFHRDLSETDFNRIFDVLNSEI